MQLRQLCERMERQAAWKYKKSCEWILLFFHLPHWYSNLFLSVHYFCIWYGRNGWSIARSDWPVRNPRLVKNLVDLGISILHSHAYRLVLMNASGCCCAISDLLRMYYWRFVKVDKGSIGHFWVGHSWYEMYWWTECDERGDLTAFSNCSRPFPVFKLAWSGQIPM